MEAPIEAPFASLEREYIEEYLRSRGQTLESVRHLPQPMAHKLMQEASVYASCKLAEIQAREHELHELAAPPSF